MGLYREARPARGRATRDVRAHPWPRNPSGRSSASHEMTPAEWESLCDGCGRCCLVRFEDEETGEVIPTRVACRLLDCETARCSNYPDRKRHVPDCIALDAHNVEHLTWMPRTCAYRRVHEGTGPGPLAPPGQRATRTATRKCGPVGGGPGVQRDGAGERGGRHRFRGARPAGRPHRSGEKRGQRPAASPLPPAAPPLLRRGSRSFVRARLSTAPAPGLTSGHGQRRRRGGGAPEGRGGERLARVVAGAVDGVEALAATDPEKAARAAGVVARAGAAVLAFEVAARRGARERRRPRRYGRTDGGGRG